MKPKAHIKEPKRIERIGQLLAKGLILSAYVSSESTEAPHDRQAVIVDPILALFQQHEELSISDVMRLEDMSRTTAYRRLHELMATGEIIWQGKGPATRYRLSTNPKTQKA